MQLNRDADEAPIQSRSELSSSISACMRRLYSSDQCAPGLESTFLFTFALALGGALAASGGFRAGTLSLSVRRGEAGGGESGLFIRCSEHHIRWVGEGRILANRHDICTFLLVHRRRSRTLQMKDTADQGRRRFARSPRVRGAARLKGRAPLTAVGLPPSWSTHSIAEK